METKMYSNEKPVKIRYSFCLIDIKFAGIKPLTKYQTGCCQQKLIHKYHNTTHIQASRTDLRARV